MKVVLCGYNWTGCKALDLLLEGGNEVFVYTHELPPQMPFPDLTVLCRKRGVSYSLEDISTSELPFKPDIICSIYYRHFIKQHVIEACDGKIFNLHPSLLPKYRGCSSLAWAIVNGDKNAGFTYHLVDDGFDTGNIILQYPVAIEEWDTALSLNQRVMFESMRHFDVAFARTYSEFKAKPQTGKSTYYSRGAPYEGRIDPAWSDAQVERFLRAMYYPPYPKATFYGQPVLDMAEFRYVKNKVRA